MVLGINLNNRSTQIGLGVTGAVLGAALLARRGSSGEGSQKGISFDHGSISSYEEDTPVRSMFSSLYNKVFGPRNTEPTLSPDPLTEITLVEIETEPVHIGESTKRTFLGSLGTLFKAIILLPVVIIASILKGFFTGISSLFGNKVSF